jgi:hypothetical protein
VELARSGVPEHAHLARACEAVGPVVTALASPVTIRRNLGMARTFCCGLPRNSSETAAGVRMWPRLPSCPPPGRSASSPTWRMSRSTGQKYADRSPRWQVVAAPARDVSVELPSVEALPT